MAKISIEPSSARQSLPLMQDLESNLRERSNDVEGVRNSLNDKIAGREQIDKRLSEVIQQMELEAQRVLALRNSMEEIIRRYEQAEDANLGRNEPTGRGKFGGETTVEETIDADRIEFTNLLDFLNVWLNYARGKEKIDVLEPFSSLLDVIEAAQDMKEGNGNAWGNWLSYVGGVIKTDKELVSLLDKYGNIHFVGGLGMITGAAQIASEFADGFWKDGRINPDFFKNPIKMTQGIKDFLVGVDDLTFPIKAKHIKIPEGLDGFKAELARDTEIIAPIKSLIDMAIYGTADAVEKFRDGTDTNEIAQWLLGTGITGADSLVSSWTLGVVSLDTNAVMDNFSDSISYTQNVLKNLDIPDAAKVALAIPASVPTAAWAMGKSFFDFGYGIGEGIKNKVKGIFG